jgi:hypothetical protein
MGSATNQVRAAVGDGGVQHSDKCVRDQDGSTRLRNGTDMIRPCCPHQSACLGTVARSGRLCIRQPCTHRKTIAIDQREAFDDEAAPIAYDEMAGTLLSVKYRPACEAAHRQFKRRVA